MKFDELANAFLSALDKIGRLKGDDFDYFDTACELLEDWTNSEILDFLDKYGHDNEEV